MLRNLPIIDADARKLENPVVFLDYVAERHRSRVRVGRDERGRAAWEIDDRDGAGQDVRRNAPCPGFAPAGGPFAAADSTLGAMFHRVRRADMDREGIDVQVIFPTFAATFASLRDGELAAALCRAYNDYIHADCARAATRCVPVGVIPAQHTDAAVEELRRCVVDLDMPAVLLPPGVPDGAASVRSLAHPSLAALYETAEYLDAALVVHAAAGFGAPASNWVGADPIAQEILHGRAQVQAALAQMVFGGVFERFARLRCGFFDAGCGWLPDFVFALSRRWRQHGRQRAQPELPPLFRGARFALESLRESSAGGLLTRQRRVRELRALGEYPTPPTPLPPPLAEIPAGRNPEEYFARGQVFLSVSRGDPAPAQLRRAFGPVGEKIACWSSGYGNAGDDAEFAGCVERMTTDPQVGLDYVERLLSRNAARLYGERLLRRIDAAAVPPAPPR